MATGQALLNAGRHAEAEAAFRQILAGHPNHPGALHGLGTLALLRDDPAAAVPLLALSLRHHHHNAPAFSNLCAALRQLNRLPEAATAGREAILLDPGFAPGHGNLASVLLDQHAFAEAEAPLRRYIALVPDCTEQRFQLAVALMSCQRQAEAEPVLRDLLRLTPDDGRALANLGVVLKNQNRTAEAIAAYRRAMVLMPGEAGLLNNLGLALSQLDDRATEAALWLRRALALWPDYADAWLNLGLLMRTRNRIEAAQEHCRTALRHRPDHAEAHTLLATCLLLKGDMAAGFAEYEWRTRLKDFAARPRIRTTPAWTGDDPAGRTILVHDEQGLGDGIQFARFAPLLHDRGARVVVECHDLLVGLFGTLPNVAAVVGRGSPTRPAHDAHAALLSLPHLLGLTTLPDTVPYLRPDPGRVEHWRPRLGPQRGLRVGLVWAGNPEFKDDRRRSPGLAALLPLLDVPGVTFFALQKGAGRADLEALKPRLGPNLTDLGPEIGDFVDTAAIMAGLDLVISSCTAPPHLAGALGRPVWLVLPYSADWRWLAHGDGSPWYPTARLFRQDRPGDWASVVGRVRAALVQAVTTAAR
ncbi:tetratricopeptide repeat protein [Novispirillum sp. DQ9]|uniref:tetratricopeptide repeat protein n=1 Tax=Novispirillum sp. DQ9 TaxID=3398612 RepID=UPI003C7D1304